MCFDPTIRWACRHVGDYSIQHCSIFDPDLECYLQEEIRRINSPCAYCENSISESSFTNVKECKELRKYACGHEYPSTLPQNVNLKVVESLECDEVLGWECLYCQNMADDTDIWRIEAGPTNKALKRRKIRLYNTKSTSEKWTWSSRLDKKVGFNPYNKSKHTGATLRLTYVTIFLRCATWLPAPMDHEKLPLNQYHELFLEGSELPEE
jgi:hypothetical protein